MRWRSSKNLLKKCVLYLKENSSQRYHTEQVYHDGHTTAIDLYMNFEIDDADITTGGADAITVSGTVTVTWINLGDN